VLCVLYVVSNYVMLGFCAVCCVYVHNRHTHDQHRGRAHNVQIMQRSYISTHNMHPHTQNKHRTYTQRAQYMHPRHSTYYQQQHNLHKTYTQRTDCFTCSQTQSHSFVGGYNMYIFIPRAAQLSHGPTENAQNKETTYNMQHTTQTYMLKTCTQHAHNIRTSYT